MYRHTPGYLPDHTFGVMFVRHPPRTAAVFTDQGVVIVVHTVGASPIIAFPARRVVIAVAASVVWYAVLTIASYGGGGDCTTVAAVTAPVVGIAVADTAYADAAAEARGGRRRVGGIGARASPAGAGRRRVRRV